MRKILGVVLLLGIAAVGLQAKKYMLTSTTVTPGARGEINTDNDDNGNLKVKIKVEHLADPENLSPPAVTYVVWFQGAGSSPESQGRLKVNKNLDGELETTTPLKNFNVFITAEMNPGTTSPGGTTVLSGAVQP